MAVLARRSGVPVPTIKHYLREGLLPPPSLRTSKNMAFYDAALVPRIQAIKELQRTRFLPLKLIREMLEAGGAAEEDATAAEAIARVVSRAAPRHSRTRAQLLAAGMREPELDWLVSMGAVTPVRRDGEDVYEGDDLAVLQTLGAARKAGLRPDMLPLEIVETYVRALRDLVRAEISMFRAGVLSRAGGDVSALTEAAATLSERLVVLLRRKLLVPTLRQIVAEEVERGSRASAPRGGPRRKARGK